MTNGLILGWDGGESNKHFEFEFEFEDPVLVDCQKVYTIPVMSHQDVPEFKQQEAHDM